MSPTLPAFSEPQKTYAHRLLATQVAEMMGRKFEEGDWSKVYTQAKGMQEASWSNLSIDIMHGSLGVEHKMICRPSHKPIMDACGTAIMHPAGTRAIRIPLEEDPTIAAREVLRQYGELVDERTAIVRVLHSYNHGKVSREIAIDQLVLSARMTRSSAGSALPQQRKPVGNPDDEPDMRMGWLLWETELKEFLYFEERMIKPVPEEFRAEWRDSGGGRRRTSRNLWVYRIKTGEKQYSITTEAGAKIQPYFTVPAPGNPNLYYFRVQGEEVENGMVRVWLTQTTAELLKEAVGELTPEAIAVAVNAQALVRIERGQDGLDGTNLAVAIEVPLETYRKLVSGLEGVSDEHTFKLLVEILRGTR